MARPRTLPDHVCPACGERYRPHSTTQVYCSAPCRWKHKHHPSLIWDVDLRAEVEAHKRERDTAPLYRYWGKHA